MSPALPAPEAARDAHGASNSEGAAAGASSSSSSSKGGSGATSLEGAKRYGLVGRLMASFGKVRLLGPEVDDEAAAVAV